MRQPTLCLGMQNMRVDFQFDKAAFAFRALPFKLPYPVPFKLLGDETKGWIDVTYLSKDGKLRLTRGNKGVPAMLLLSQLQAVHMSCSCCHIVCLALCCAYTTAKPSSLAESCCIVIGSMHRNHRHNDKAVDVLHALMVRHINQQLS